MNIDINLVNSLKVGEFIQVSEMEVLACLESGECYDACFFYDEDVCPECTSNGKDKIYKILKLKQSC